LDNCEHTEKEAQTILTQCKNQHTYVEEQLKQKLTLVKGEIGRYGEDINSEMTTLQESYAARPTAGPDRLAGGPMCEVKLICQVSTYSKISLNRPCTGLIALDPFREVIHLGNTIFTFS
jgi:hypothetical protein